MELTITQAKAAARALQRGLQRQGHEVGWSHCLELVAQQSGFADWNTAAAVLTGAEDSSTTEAGLGSPVPILRVQEDPAVRAFYLDYLGFTVEWEHRFEPELPLYMRIRRDEAVLDLSEHHGDGTPGSAVWIPLADVRALHAELRLRPYTRLRPGIDPSSPGGPTMDLIDPFGNHLRFCTPE